MVQMALYGLTCWILGDCSYLYAVKAEDSRDTYTNEEMLILSHSAASLEQMNLQTSKSEN